MAHVQRTTPILTHASTILIFPKISLATVSGNCGMCDRKHSHLYGDPTTHSDTNFTPPVSCREVVGDRAVYDGCVSVADANASAVCTQGGIDTTKKDISGACGVIDDRAISYR
jgi:hypothetical protein